ncbi:MAG: hypothetical protein HY716_10890 [Planctomycetes bacterium]|nr:hypothetical protein [Planctomycetota bacterium]
MRIDLIGASQTVCIPSPLWPVILALAQMAGWEPEGDYFQPAGQVVSREEARALGQALDAALPLIPDVDVCLARTVEHCTELNRPIERPALDGAEVWSPLEALSGPGKEHVRAVIALCRLGGFRIA